MLRSTIKLIAPVLTGLIMIASCSSSKNAIGVNREDIKGTWTLNDITTRGLATNEYVKLTVLDEGSKDCLTGSTWVLPNNGYGSYTIQPRTGCTPGLRGIVWSYRTEGDQPVFQFKRTEEGVKAKEITAGYKFRIVSADKTSMVLESEVVDNGRSVYITYNFSKS